MDEYILKCKKQNLKEIFKCLQDNLDLFDEFISSCYYLKIDPYENQLDMKRLKGAPGLFRIRFGRYRLVIHILDNVIYCLGLFKRTGKKSDYEKFTID